MNMPYGDKLYLELIYTLMRKDPTDQLKYIENYGHDGYSTIYHPVTGLKVWVVRNSVGVQLKYLDRNGNEQSRAAFDIGSDVERIVSYLKRISDEV